MINTIALEALHRAEFIEFLRATYKICSNSAQNSPEMQKKLDVLLNIIKLLDDKYNEEISNAGSKELGLIDAQRDYAIIGISKTAWGYTYHKDIDKRSAAFMVYNRIESYGANIADLNDAAQSVVMDNLVRDLKNDPELLEAVKKLGFADWVEYMGTKNQEFVQKYNQEHHGLEDGEPAPSDKEQALNAYSEVKEQIETEQKDSPAPDTLKTVKNLNTLIERYADIIRYQ